jgi:3-oxoadipate enol-lactonase
MAIAEVNGQRLYYEVHGEGDPLLCVHGLACDTLAWIPQVQAFAAAHRTVIFDNRDVGQSSQADGEEYDIADMARDALALADDLEIDSFHLVGISMGGAIAQEIALRSAARLLSLTLHDTGFHFDPERNEGLVKWNRARNKIAESQGMAALAAMPSPFKTPPHMPAGREAETRERMARMSVDGFIGAGDGLNSWRGTKDRLDQITTPTLVIYGELDAPVLVKSGERLAATIADAVRVIVPEAAHCPQEERPELFNAALRAHLERNAAKRPEARATR